MEHDGDELPAALPVRAEHDDDPPVALPARPDRDERDERMADRRAWYRDRSDQYDFAKIARFESDCVPHLMQGPGSGS